MNRDDVGTTLKIYFVRKKITQAQIAKRLGVTRATVSSLLLGRKYFGAKVAERWHREFGFSMSWLVTGMGDMFDDSQKDADFRYKELLTKITEQEETIKKLQQDYDNMLNIFFDICQKKNIVLPIEMSEKRHTQC